MFNVIIEKLKRTIRNSPEELPAIKTAPLASVTSSFLRHSEFGADHPAQTPARYGTWAYACIQRIAECVAQVPFKISQGSINKPGESVIEKGSLYHLMQNPHPYLTQYEFFELITSWLLARGSTFILPLTENGEPVNLLNYSGGNPEPSIHRLKILSPNEVAPALADGELIGWHYKPAPAASNRGFNLLPGELIWIRLPDIEDFWSTIAPLQVADTAVQADIASSKFMNAVVSNNGEVGLFIKTQQYLTDEQRAQIIASLQARKRGRGIPDRPIILEAGLDVIQPALSSADLQFLENRKFTRQEICAIFGVPQEILGFSEDANRSVSESARLNFIENRIVPLCRRIESALTPLIKAYGRDLYGWFDFDSLPIMQNKRLQRIQTAQQLWAMGIPFNDINQNLDLGFPRYSWHDFGYIQNNVQKISPIPATANHLNNTSSDPIARLFNAINNAQTEDNHPLPHQIPPELKQKLRRYIFEQRCRILKRLGELSAALNARDLSAEQIFPIQEENTLLNNFILQHQLEQTDFETLANHLNSKLCVALDDIIKTVSQEDGCLKCLQFKVKSYFQSLSKQIS